MKTLVYTDYKSSSLGTTGTGPSFTIYPETLEHLPTAVHRLVAEELIRSGEWTLVPPADPSAGGRRAAAC